MAEWMAVKRAGHLAVMMVDYWVASKADWRVVLMAFLRADWRVGHLDALMAHCWVELRADSRVGHLDALMVHCWVELMADCLAEMMVVMKAGLMAVHG
eukprot:CAMPEP_0201603484 /NCGR_PEP_ID=MMETSP0492-20130828/3916_1 /ASSEMBLY_ACC=CAM_ASM_000837 /TAXON_ID=420259 /ORGANISM="Thalassiosira gravida, Strain GMp14c1" /LENGTH=97 /DNA_ID=CAMNT_0048067265 /DNA_START=11 /DNA_END=304 /DNA_ORIENTATION=-